MPLQGGTSPAAPGRAGHRARTAAKAWVRVQRQPQCSEIPSLPGSVRAATHRAGEGRECFGKTTGRCCSYKENIQMLTSDNNSRDAAISLLMLEELLLKNTSFQRIDPCLLPVQSPEHLLLISWGKAPSYQQRFCLHTDTRASMSLGWTQAKVCSLL